MALLPSAVINVYRNPYACSLVAGMKKEGGCYMTGIFNSGNDPLSSGTGWAALTHSGGELYGEERRKN